MTAIISFFISLFLIALMLAVKYFNISLFRHKMIEKLVEKNDEHLVRIAGKTKHIASKIHFQNARRFSLIILNFLKENMIALKRHFDSKQPKFFLKPQTQKTQGKHSVSFFLKNISEYRNSLRK